MTQRGTGTEATLLWLQCLCPSHSNVATVRSPNTAVRTRSRGVAADRVVCITAQTKAPGHVCTMLWSPVSHVQLKHSPDAVLLEECSRCDTLCTCSSHALSVTSQSSCQSSAPGLQSNLMMMHLHVDNCFEARVHQPTTDTGSSSSKRASCSICIWPQRGSQ